MVKNVVVDDYYFSTTKEFPFLKRETAQLSATKTLAFICRQLVSHTQRFSVVDNK